MSLFPYHEMKYYFFGLRMGLRNLFTNGLGLGFKKTIGKITQPVNAYSRFPEYFYFDRAIRSHLGMLRPGAVARILDVGSPKTLGLYLAATSSAEVTMTDISELNVDEYKTMWRAMECHARGRAVFELQDARSLKYSDGEFDIVYSMSVIEHIEGESGDSQGIREMIRVLKPGGLLVVSVPFGSRFEEQQRAGFSGAVKETGDSQLYFFQRIYDQPTLAARVLQPAAALEQVKLTAVWRRNQWLVRGFGALGMNLKGLLGFLNPVLSAVVNRSAPGFGNSFEVRYGHLHTARDIYGDLIMCGKKNRY